MTENKQKPKSDYNVVSIYVRGDRKYVNQLKSLAANADKPLADYVREMLDCAIACKDNSFFEQGGKPNNQSGKV